MLRTGATGRCWVFQVAYAVAQGPSDLALVEGEQTVEQTVDMFQEQKCGCPARQHRSCRPAGSAGPGPLPPLVREVAAVRAP